MDARVVDRRDPIEGLATGVETGAPVIERDPSVLRRETRIVGRGVPRIDAIPKVSGEAEYTVDRKMPGMLIGKILRSPHPHALITSIDTSAAKRLKGVRAVITAEDVPGNLFSFYQWLADKNILCADKVRYVGDEVAAVAAVDEDTAEEALELIKVEYEPLPPVLSVEEALRPGAPLVHDDKESNATWRVERLFGDPDAALAECDHVVEGTFVTHQVAHACLEVSNCIARWDKKDRLTIWTTTQAPHTQRQEVARVLGIPQRNVRIINSYMGGGFGARLVMDMKLPIAAVLSRITGRPVRIVNTRSEEFTTAKARYPYTMRLKTGATKEGRILVRDLKVTGDAGAYHDKGPATINFSSMMFGTLYNVPNIRFEGQLVYTNNEMGTAFRGFGNPQVTFATESQIDELAEKLGMDPLELRLRNANQPMETTFCGAEVDGCGMADCMHAAAEAVEWERKRSEKVPLRGVGLANMVHTGGGGRFYGYNSAEAFIKFSDEGTVTLITSALDMGQGAHTVMAQIAAEELGVRMSDINVLSNDTDLTPYDLGSWGSRASFMNGNAVSAAAKDAMRELVAAAAEMLEADPDDIVVEDSRIWVRGSEERHELAEIVDHAVNQHGATISGTGRFVDRLPEGYTIPTAFAKNIPCFSFGTQAVEVEVDDETGQIKVLKVAAAHETGTTINQTMAEGQIEGAVAQGIGFALMEELVREEGRVINDRFLDYKIPNIGDMPEVVAICVESEGTAGPFGAKGIGEPGLVPTAPAIANAVYDAIGVRFSELPITRERVLEALRERREAT
ncbi:MAG TPA: xanthine dehydrogenase family protein molybdopterin-binding subunit [Thermoleophilia bacterium]|nr:xanthine dehydrogenase family protein molybdopterin-binding subunit [Thermoleophilia bacterium]